ncbi:MAG TPA: 6-bladed beta-propeller, partial [Longimicrobium sp.]|nr:6-bladed beta-propeller [Longimicrobium sp.]
MAAAPFDSVFRLADTITPEQPDSVPIGLISGIDFAEDGSFVISDARSARVMRYAADGRLLTRMGRQGYGPGEFQLAMFPVLDERGRIHALDFHQPRITVFNADGSFVRTVPVGHLGNRISEVAVLPGGDYLIIAFHGEKQDLL